MINFKLMKIFIFLCFHVHKNSQINHFNSIFKSGKFWGVTGTNQNHGNQKQANPKAHLGYVHGRYSSPQQHH